jgi:hypothetical protein
MDADNKKRLAQKMKNQNKVVHNTSTALTLEKFHLTANDLTSGEFSSYIEKFGLVKVK